MDDHGKTPELPFDVEMEIAHSIATDPHSDRSEDHSAGGISASQNQLRSGSHTELAENPDVEMPVRLVRSTRRRKTVQARLVGGVVELRIPAAMTNAEAEKYRDDLVPRLLRRAKSDQVDLTERARMLATDYGFPQPASVRWVSNQNSRWGSCTIDDATIRISDRLADFPHWVLDYVLVHELAHLIEPNHSPAFHDLVARYPKSERATGFLIAKGLEPD